MLQRVALWSLGACMVTCSAVGQVVVRNANRTISDSPTVLDQMTVTNGPASITDLHLVLTIDHPDTAQLDIALIPPGGGVYLHLSSDNGFLTPNFTQTRFDDHACWYIYQGLPPYNGTFRPEGGMIFPYTGTVALPGVPLSGFSDLFGTNANGVWTLLVDDDTAGGTGLLRRWSLEFNGALDPQGPIDIQALCSTGMVSPVVTRPGGTVRFSITAPPRDNPPSTGTSAILFLDGLDGPVLQIYDNGLGADAVAGDHVFTADFQIPATAIPGKADVYFVTYDDQGRVGDGSISLDVAPLSAWFEHEDGGRNAGGMPGSAMDITRTTPFNQIRGYLSTQGDVDMYRVSICDPSQFSATTVGGTAYDTQLFLFNSQGFGVAMNDDAFASYQSTLTNQFVTQPGDYYLTISRYDNDPVDLGGSELWDDATYIYETAPNGPGAGNNIGGWWGTTFLPVGPYTIHVTGVANAGLCPQSNCDTIDFNHDGLMPDTADLDDFLSIFSGGGCLPPRPFNCNTDIDFNNDGLFPDAGDIDVFLRVFSGGPC